MPQLERESDEHDSEYGAAVCGDIYLLDEYLKRCGFNAALDAIGYRNPDSLYALLSYYILSPHANSHAQDWWELTYARFLYPRAQLASQRISEMLADIGSEDAKRRFFREYFRFLETQDTGKDDEIEGIDDGVLIDSSGLPNSIRFPLTAVNNHNGVISEEIRLIYVVQQRTGMPLFFRYVAGNIIDVSTITRTIAELKANGVNTKFAILDAGYYTGANADTLIDGGISFVARMKSNFKVYKRAVKNHLDRLESRENAVLYNKRIVYIKCIPCRIGSKEDKPAYAYLCKDMAMQHEMEKHTIERAGDENLSDSDIFDDLKKQGVFVLISTRKIAKEKLLPTYYMRDQVEKIFELCKQEGKILPGGILKVGSFLNQQIDVNLVYAARTLGMSEMRIFWTVIMPSAGPGIVSGTVLTFSRALGEYGATSMLAGNITGRTGTISQKIAMVIQDGDYKTAGFWVIVILVIACLIIIAMNLAASKKLKHIRRY